jgi:BASS family bile acid:Na+ symporter
MSLTGVILLALKTSIGLSVLALGLNATLSDATSMFRRPADLIRAFVSMNVAMPLFAIAMAMMFDIHQAVKIALVTLSVSPVPPLFPRKALEQGGRQNYIVGLLVAMALLAIVVIPIAMEVFERLFGMPLQMTARPVAVLVSKTILAPLLIGIIIHHFLPSIAQRSAKPIGVLASVLLIVSVVPVLFVFARTLFSLIGNGTILVLAAFTAFGLLVGFTLAGSEPDKKRVLAIATSARHPGMAAAIAQANFPNQKLAVPAIILYLMISAIVVGLAMRRGKGGRSRKETERPLAA